MTTLKSFLDYLNEQGKQKQAIIDSIKAKQAAVDRDSFQWIIQNTLSFQKSITDLIPKSGTFYGDLFTIFRTRSTETERLEAAERLSKTFLKNPIAKKRWKAIGWKIIQELKARSKSRGTTTEEELRRSIVATLFIIAKPAIGPYGPKGGIKATRRLLNEEVTKDFLGSAWRRYKDEQIDPEKKDDKDKIQEFEMWQALDAAITEANLGEAEKTLLISNFLGAKTVDTAKKLGITDSSARVKMHRARKKIAENIKKIL